MTVKELIEELKQYPDNMQVTVSDSEYGADELTDVKVSTYLKWTGEQKGVKIVCIELS